MSAKQTGRMPPAPLFGGFLDSGRGHEGIGPIDQFLAMLRASASAGY
jgi:hypothetical protein